MARKKSATPIEETQNKEEKIIVLNEGHTIDIEELRKAENELLGGEEEMVEIENVTPIEEAEDEEDLHILGENDEAPEIIIDTTHLDEELNMSDIFKESGLGIMPIGGGKDKEEKKEKKKHKHNKEEKADEETKELSKEVLAAFTMVLKNKDYEPIPYPFGDNEMAYNLAFEQCVEMVDHMAVAKFTRNNPTRSLKDAFKNVFTVADENTEDNNMGEQEMTKRKSEELIKPETVKPLTDNEANEERPESETKLEARMKEISEAFDKEIEAVLMKVLDKGSEDPEDVLKALLDNSKELEDSSMGKLIKKITGTGISDIIRAEINGDTTNEVEFKTKFEAAMEKLVNDADKIEKAIDSDVSLDKLIEVILQVLTPDVKDMSLLQIMKARKELVPHMTDSEFSKWLVEIRKERSSENTTEKVEEKESEHDNSVDKNIEEIEKHKSQLERDMNKVEETSAKFHTALSFSRNLIKNMGVKTAQ